MKVTHAKAAYLDDHDLIIVRDAVQSYALTLRERMKQWNRLACGCFGRRRLRGMAQSCPGLSAPVAGSARSACLLVCRYGARRSTGFRQCKSPRGTRTNVKNLDYAKSQGWIYQTKHGSFAVREP